MYCIVREINHVSCCKSTFYSTSIDTLNTDSIRSEINDVRLCKSFPFYFLCCCCCCGSCLLFVLFFFSSHTFINLIYWICINRFSFWRSIMLNFFSFFLPSFFFFLSYIHQSYILLNYTNGFSFPILCYVNSFLYFSFFHSFINLVHVLNCINRFSLF